MVQILNMQIVLFIEKGTSGNGHYSIYYLKMYYYVIKGV